MELPKLYEPKAIQIDGQWAVANVRLRDGAVKISNHRYATKEEAETACGNTQVAFATNCISGLPEGMYVVLGDAW